MPKFALCFVWLLAAPSYAQSVPRPAKPDDTVFVRDTQPGALDTPCTFRNGGPLRIRLPIDRFVAPTDANGFLSNIAGLRQAGIVGDKAQLRMPAFDVDSTAQTSGYAPEIDKVTINGNELPKTLTGVNNQWVLNVFDVPLEYLKFPSAPGASGKPAAVENEIRIDIDVGNAGGQEYWCTAIDWVEMTVPLMAPIILSHGISAQADSWSGEVVNYLSTNKYAFAAMSLDANGSVDGNARLLSSQATAAAKRFGARRVHFIVHSKGGLDTRRFLTLYHDPDEMQILSLTTLSTPHKGSVHADLSILNRTSNDPQSTDPTVQAYLDSDDWASGWIATTFATTPSSPGLDDLQTTTAVRFNRLNPFPPKVKLFTFGADADLDNDGSISDAEQSPLLDAIPGAERRATNATVMYRLLRDGNRGVATVKSEFWGLNEWTEISVTLTASRQENDLSVTTTSAQHPAQQSFQQLNANHSNIKSERTLRMALENIKSAFQLD